MVCAARPPRSRRSATPDRGAGPRAAGDDRDFPRERLTFGQHSWAFVKELTAVVVGALIVSALLRGFVGQMFVIPSASMQNTLQEQDRVAVLKIGSVHRGEVVVFEDPGGWLSGPEPAERGPVGRALEFVGLLPDTGTGHLIKRVVGMPGDRVVCCDAQQRITVNAQPLNERSYLYPAPNGIASSASNIAFDVTVPAGRIFVLGDNRDNSRDSRCHFVDATTGRSRGDEGFVSTELVVGHAVAVVWPLARASRLSTPDAYAGVPASGSPPAHAVVQAGPEASC